MRGKDRKQRKKVGQTEKRNKMGMRKKRKRKRRQYMQLDEK